MNDLNDDNRFASRASLFDETGCEFEELKPTQFDGETERQYGDRMIRNGRSAIWRGIKWLFWFCLSVNATTLCAIEIQTGKFDWFYYGWIGCLILRSIGIFLEHRYPETFK